MALTSMQYACTLCEYRSAILPVDKITDEAKTHLLSHMVAAPRQGAPRQAGTESPDGQLRQTEYGDHATLRALGIAVRVGTKVPTGAAVRLDVHDAAIWLEPEEAKRLSIALDIAAREAVHEDRAARRG